MFGLIRRKTGMAWKARGEADGRARQLEQHDSFMLQLAQQRQAHLTEVAGLERMVKGRDAALDEANAARKNLQQAIDVLVSELTRARTEQDRAHAEHSIAQAKLRAELDGAHQELERVRGWTQEHKPAPPVRVFQIKPIGNSENMGFVEVGGTAYEVVLTESELTRAATEESLAALVREKLRHKLSHA